MWDKLPTAAVWRRPDNEKWYGVIMAVRGTKLGLASDSLIEILDVRAPEVSIADHKTIFPAYHMNKKNWLTYLLDGSVPRATLELAVRQSYQMVAKS